MHIQVHGVSLSTHRRTHAHEHRAGPTLPPHVKGLLILPTRTLVRQYNARSVVAGILMS